MGSAAHAAGGVGRQVMGVNDCPTGYVCFWDALNFEGGMTATPPPRLFECRWGSWIEAQSVANFTPSSVYVWENDNCTGRWEYLSPGANWSASHFTYKGVSLADSTAPEDGVPLLCFPASESIRLRHR
ncbi:peptidase inhibitor family I36 protein [Streptomyces griseoloalbus]|uniref:peptidase inhibitor family I36 protein n=1 Tax=Streptomyces griseoloalbus TaxID=67303 RepID=UPI0033AD4752